ncbi:MAG: M23 family metallopeptidase, partial [Actinomycetota bacterium]|nr:M23 family metallopeptidase [Actinomycetota bacterium]
APPATDPPSSTQRLHCPVAGVSAFVDSWGAPRSGGRSHQGVDMMAARGTPVVAVEAGTVALDNSSLGGISLWLMADAGTHYYYAHLDGWADGLESGQHVEAGDLVGSVGSSGNASAWAPHLHFEQHPGGGQAINPYPLVVSLCR